MRKTIIALAAACAVATPVTASAEIADMFENTLVSRYPDGGWVRHWFNRDGTYSAQFSDGRRLSASWRIEGQRVCLNGIRPAFMMISRYCSPVVEARVGQTWVARDPLGRRVQNELSPGR